MPTVTQVNDLKINKLTKAQYDEAVQSGVIGENEISIITDLDAGQVIQVDVLPTASATEEGKIYQYIGETDNTYTNGYFYKCTETLSFVGPAEDATEGEPGESMVFALDSDAFAAYLQTKSIVLTGQTTFCLLEEADAETGDSIYALQDADYVTIEEFTSLADMESTTGITWGGQEDFTGDFPYSAENTTGFVVDDVYSWKNIEVQPAGDSLPDQTGQSGKFLTTDGTDASWGDALINNSPTNDKLVIGDGATATYPNTQSIVVVGAYATGGDHYATAIGAHASANYMGTAVGRETFSASNSVAIGSSARATGAHAIQISAYKGGHQAVNPDANTFKVANNNGNYEMMSADGTIPEDRLADTTNTQQGDVLTLDANGNAVWQAGGSGGLPSQTGQSGKFLTTDGTDASWSDKALVNKSTVSDSYAVTSLNSGLTTTSTASVVLGYAGEAKSTRSVVVGYSASTGTNVSTSEGQIAIGPQAFAGGIGAIALGGMSVAGGWPLNNYAIALGSRAGSKADYAIQLGSTGSVTTNTDANTFKVANNNGNFEIMSADGTIPEARLADTTSATEGQVLQLDSNNNAVWKNIISTPSTIPTLLSNSWTENPTTHEITQTVSIVGVTLTNLVMVGPTPVSAEDYNDSDVVCIAQGVDTLTFKCATVPSVDLTLNVLCF